MNAVRRRILRNGSLPVTGQANIRRNEAILAKLASDRLALRRWMSKLRRAFNAVGRLQASIDRREKQLHESGR